MTDPDQPTLLATVLAEQGVAQADVARRTNLSTKHINHLAQGNARMSVDVALRLEFALGVPADEWMRAYTDVWINEQRDAVMLAAFRQQLEWWKKARDDDLNLIMALSDERDQFKEIIGRVRKALNNQSWRASLDVTISEALGEPVVGIVRTEPSP